MNNQGKIFSAALTVVLAIGLGLLVIILAKASARAEPLVRVYFSPNGGAQEAITEQLRGAKKEIKIQAYGFTSEAIAREIIAARKRGVAVIAVLDKSNETAKYSAARFLASQGAAVFIDFEPKIAHSKVILIDGETLITGSFNFTKAAETANVENCLVIQGNPALCRQYEDNFNLRKSKSRKYQ